MTAGPRASAIYRGSVSHRRLQPKRYDFSYKVYMFYLDLDELPTLFPGSRLWGTGRAAPLRFERSDYFGDNDRPLADCIRELVSQTTGDRPAGPVRMLANVRGLGYVFNPICVYYLFDRTGERLTHVVADVTNTPWRESHPYVFTAEKNGEPVRGRAEKKLHVSPFLEMDYTYELRATAPGDELHLSIANRRGDATHFVADLRLERLAATNENLRRVAWRRPAMAALVTARIYAQALRLRLRGLRPFPHTPAAGRDPHAEVPVNPPPAKEKTVV